MNASSVLKAPYTWFANIIELMEKRPFHFANVLLFCVFVAIVRMLGEWLLAGNEDQLYLTDFIISVGFYWFCFFAYTLAVWIFVPQAWTRTMNVVLIGIFLGIFPPVIDVFISGVGNFRYGFLWDFPTGFSPFLYSPEHRIPLGESITLWLTVVFSGLYVWYRSRTWYMGLLAGLLAWGIAVINAALLPTSLNALQRGLGLMPQHLLLLITCSYFLLTLGIYFLFQPRLFGGLLKRSIHALPFVLITLAGAAFLGPLRFDIFFYAGVVLLVFLVALGQNDWHDRAEDARQGRSLYIEAHDVHFLNIVGLAIAFTLLGLGTFNGVLVLLILAVSFLYSYPMYRAKRYFPSNLKIEGVWGATSFLIGIVAQIEYEAFGQPAWSVHGTPKGSEVGALSPETLLAILLVFGGYSLIASLKDYKDVEVDLESGMQTWYTLARRRGWNEIRLHRSLVGAACLALAAPFPLLAYADRFPAWSIIGGLPLVAVVWLLMQGKPSRKAFTGVLATISGQLLYLVVLLGAT